VVATTETATFPATPVVVVVPAALDSAVVPDTRATPIEDRPLMVAREYRLLDG
jgi:hypothetical protein